MLNWADPSAVNYLFDYRFTITSLLHPASNINYTLQCPLQGLNLSQPFNEDSETAHNEQLASVPARTMKHAGATVRRKIKNSVTSNDTVLFLFRAMMSTIAWIRMWQLVQYQRLAPKPIRN